LLFPPAILATWGIPLRSVVLTDDHLTLPISHRRTVVIPLGQIAGVGATPGDVTEALTVGTEQGEVYRSRAVCMISTPDTGRMPEIVEAIWSAIRSVQGDDGPLVTTQGSCWAPMPRSFPGPRRRLVVEFRRSIAESELPEVWARAIVELEQQFGEEVNVRIDQEKRQLVVTVPPGFPARESNVYRRMKSIRGFRRVKYGIVQQDDNAAG
jgi:hypothetical protein